MTYELTVAGKNENRYSLCTVGTLAEARAEAHRAADEGGKPVTIERVTRTGASTIIERVREAAR